MSSPHNKQEKKFDVIIMRHISVLPSYNIAVYIMYAIRMLSLMSIYICHLNCVHAIELFSLKVIKKKIQVLILSTE